MKPSISGFDYDTIKNVLGNSDIVICIGLSHDDRGFLTWFKEHNANGKIVAIDLIKPSYIGNEDFFLQGDLQQLVPKLSNLIMQN